MAFKYMRMKLLPSSPFCRAAELAEVSCVVDARGLLAVLQVSSDGARTVQSTEAQHVWSHTLLAVPLREARLLRTMQRL